MSYDTATYDEVEPRAPGMYFLRNELDCENLGFTVLDATEGWDGMEHDHAEDGQEEVYLLVDGSGVLTVDGDELQLDPGEAVRVDADASRHLSFDEESTMVIAGAP
ncbi:Cupin domain-containing protein [Halovenus aranensis]|jgi:mannose-6-phosphate isomerase-like protein (cupin superfamily)|uniref:Cupin domain-containing protein n=1 Tax=Halovenus aranensis TaxID=890420 RepID=A0A1G8VGN1_9EURY|nr:cupin domain-containing protein [Halovenus aranensis]SDJ64475.1 Cupin domain-containing protein [Halovenus aranensis]